MPWLQEQVLLPAGACVWDVVLLFAVPKQMMKIVAAFVLKTKQKIT